VQDSIIRNFNANIYSDCSELVDILFDFDEDYLSHQTTYLMDGIEKLSLKGKKESRKLLMGLKSNF